MTAMLLGYRNQRSARMVFPPCLRSQEGCSPKKWARWEKRRRRRFDSSTLCMGEPCITLEKRCIDRVRAKIEYGEKGGHENGYISCSDRKAKWIDYEAGVLLYAAAIWQSTDTAEGAFLAATTCIRSVLYQDWHAR